jgi:hypothetical protein
VADLRLTAAALRYYEEPLRVSELTPRDAILCQLATIAAPEVETVASRLEAAFEAVKARRLPVAEPFPDDFRLVVLFAQPSNLRAAVALHFVHYNLVRSTARSA